MAGRTKRLAAGAAVALLLVACGRDAARGPQGATHWSHETPVGPHSGALVEWGEDHRAEFVADRVKGEVTVYVLARDARTPAPVAADEVVLTIDEPVMRITLKPSPQARDPKGTSSRFVGDLPESARNWRLTGALSGVVDGNKVAGDLVEFRPHKH